ncbi:hypothetical protein IAT40_007975 [Kwoniella sp. CBS 6097]
MRVTKPAWVAHNAGEKKARCPIYSINVHPDGTRLATGGLDHKVKIWSTLPILDSEAEQEEANHKLLCTMAAHTGPVLAVRWAHHGRYLATGSDDQVVMIWGIDPAGGGRLWGSEEENYENWKALTRLAGHAADVVDLAWSRDDSMLASVGLDSKVCIWDGQSFRRLRELDLHQGFVKGVCWDPVGNFLATQSDDKTVKVWNTEDWSLVQSVSKPFETSPQNTFFRRLSWSPDGAFIAASNAMNGPVFVAAVIDREGWGSDISFVGHENTIQVAAFNPRLFFRKEDEPGRATASCMLALGANDFSISIWRNTLHKPLAVLKNVFTNDLLDLCWSNDGYQLYGSSADGSIVAISFTPEEFPELGAPEATDKVLKEYEYHPKYQRAGSVNPLSATPSMANGFGPASTASSVVNILQPRKGKDKNRRINLSNGQQGSASRLLQPPSADPFSAPIQGFANASTAQASTARMFEDAHNAFSYGHGYGQNGESSSSPRAGLKRKAVLFSDDESRAVRGRMMASTTQNGQAGPIEILRAPKVSVTSAAYSSSSSANLPVPQVQSLIRATMLAEEGNAYIEAQNSPAADGVNKLIFARDDANQWVVYLPSAVLALAVTSSFCAAACEDGSVNIYSVCGRQLSSLRLPAVVHDLQGCKGKVLIVTADGQVRVINTNKVSAVFSPTSLAHLLLPTSTSSSTASLEITKCAIRPNGVPVIITSEPAAYAYDPALTEWVTISSLWWFESSPLPPNSAGPLGEIDSTVQSMWKGKKRDAAGEWWNEAVVMGHYESKIKSCVLLDSEEEYQDWLIQYTRYLGNQGFLERAEEVLQELVGPTYQSATGTKWEAKIVALDKRAVAQEVVETLSRTKNGQELAREYGRILRKISDTDRWS